MTEMYLPMKKRNKRFGGFLCLIFTFLPVFDFERWARPG
jgi:hypothetical protein